MSAATLVAITCDGPKVGLTCTTPTETADTNLHTVRADLRRRGWARRHHGDTQVDLCPTCNPHATLEPHQAGRPPKQKETEA